MKTPDTTATPAAMKAMTRQTAANRAAMTWMTDRRMKVLTPSADPGFLGGAPRRQRRRPLQR
jgi:hypothetical protein